MSWRTLLSFGIMVAAVGCGASADLAATRTLTGVDQRQALIDAQHSLADEGLNPERIDFDKYTVTTVWVRENRRMIQYEVTVTPAHFSDAAGGAAPTEAPDGSSVTIAVSARARNRVAGGWSDPAPTRFSGSEKLLDKIVALSIRRYDPGTALRPEPAAPRSCAASLDCPAGSHCGSGRCVSECASDGDCEAGHRCDPRGRCAEPAEPAGARPEEAADEAEVKKAGRRRGHD